MSDKIPIPDRSYLLECFDYNPRTGIVKWKIRPESHFKNKQIADWWNKRWFGTIVRHRTQAALVVKLDGTPYVVSRLIYVIMGEVIPDSMEIDHRNRNPFDNRWKNLRLATRTQNVYNRSGWKKKSLPKGIRYRKKLFQARIVVNRKERFLGSFSTLEEACAAYASAISKTHGEFGCI